MKYDRTSPESIYEYSKLLVGKSLRDLVPEENLQNRLGKGGLGQLVEELFFEYEVNSEQRADFDEANLELKCTPVKKLKDDALAIKERLVCTMIDYFEIVDTPFNDSKLYHKCYLMLLLFYLHEADVNQLDLKFLFSVLWRLPEKDLVIIENDYRTIANKVKAGNAHLLSEGDTMYLGACRKGQKGDKLVPQPHSEELAPKRAFSLKPSYMRTILPLVIAAECGCYCNYDVHTCGNSLVSIEELRDLSFQDIMIKRFSQYRGMNYLELCDRLGVASSKAKSKYYNIACAMANGSLNGAEEIVKSGTVIKTIRVNYNGTINEHMSFKNLDYAELLENDDWFSSDLYELFSGNFMFVVFKQKNKNTTIAIDDRVEDEFCFDKIVFWTMPQDDLVEAEKYWEQIRHLVTENKISDLRSVLSIANSELFHIRPKARDSRDLDVNPIDGTPVVKNCYWFNSSYVKKIIEP